MPVPVLPTGPTGLLVTGTQVMEDVHFRLVRNAIVRGADVRVLGDHVFRYGPPDDAAGGEGFAPCFAVCAAASDCAAFLHDKESSHCQFKRSGGRVVHLPEADSPTSIHDVYVRVPSPPAPAPSPSFPMRPLASAERDGAKEPEQHRIFTVPNFVSAAEAATLRGLASECFRNGAAKIDDPEHVNLDMPECNAGRHAVLLSAIEERIATLTGIPAHEADPALAFSSLRSVGRHGHWLTNLHHDKNRQPQRRASVLVYLSTVHRDADGGHTVFPALPSASRAPHTGQHSTRAFRSAVGKAYSQGYRALGCRRPTDGQPREDCVETANDRTHRTTPAGQRMDHASRTEDGPRQQDRGWTSPAGQRMDIASGTAPSWDSGAVWSQVVRLCRSHAVQTDVDGAVSHTEAECERYAATAQRARTTRPAQKHRHATSQLPCIAATKVLPGVAVPPPLCARAVAVGGCVRSRWVGAACRLGVPRVCVRVISLAGPSLARTTAYRCVRSRGPPLSSGRNLPTE